MKTPWKTLLTRTKRVILMTLKVEEGELCDFRVREGNQNFDERKVGKKRTFS